MPYFISMAEQDKTAVMSQLSGPHRSLSIAVAALEIHLDELEQKNSSGSRHVWWIEQTMPDHHLIVQQLPRDWTA